MTKTLLSRTADSVYWTGRYLERSEDMARIVLVHTDAHVDLPVGEDVGWMPLLSIAGVEGIFRERHPQPRNSLGAPTTERAAEAGVVDFLLCERDNPSSVLSSVFSAREALRLARPAVPREAWELCNDLWTELQDRRQLLGTRDGRGSWLRMVLADCQRINGVLWSSMRRDAAMAFTRIGQHIERADLTCRVVAVRARGIVRDRGDDPYDEVRSMAILRSLAAYQPFRRAMPARPVGGSTVEFVLRDEAFPRTVAACLSEAQGYLKDLPRNEEVLAACTDASARLAATSVGQLSATALQAFVTELQSLIATIHHRLQSVYFCGATVSVPSESATPAEAMTGYRPRERTVADLSEGGSGRGFEVTHRSVYRYEVPAEQSYNEAHLHPRNTRCQRCLTHELEIVPEPVTWTESDDLFGNHVATFTVNGLFETLSVTASSKVLVSTPEEPPTGIEWESVQWLLERDRRPETRDARMFRSPSRLVPMAAEFADYARLSFEPKRPCAEAVRELCSRIHEDLVYEPGFTSVTTPVSEVFESRRGVCQDFAHLAVACLRAIGMSARYVSGYIETVPPPRTERLVGADASHAWASTYLPGWGWFDIDPTNDQTVTNSYVTIAWGRDYWDVSPLRGTVEGGGTSHSLEVAVDVVALT